MKSLKKAIKGVLKHRVGQSKEKGSILVEFVVALPVLFLVIWGILNLMTYLNATSHLNQAAYDASRSLAKELRGYEGVNIESKVQLDRVEKEILLIVRQNKFLTYGIPGGNEAATAFTKGECQTLYDNKEKNIFCAYIEQYDVGTGKQHQNVIVKLRSSFQIIGAFVKNMEDYVQVNATSNAPQELPDRLNYYTY